MNQITEFLQFENDMFLADQKIVQVKEMRNCLETYVYDNRANLDTYGDKAKYMEDKEREAYLEHLNQVESWLYGDGANATKDDYQQKLNDLKVVGNVVDKRYRFHDQFSYRAQQFDEIL